MFITTGFLQTKGGEPVDGWDVVACSIWPAGDRTTGAGESYDYTGEADRDAADELAKPNRVLVVDDAVYTIVSAVGMDIVPHTALRLRRSGAAGGV